MWEGAALSTTAAAQRPSGSPSFGRTGAGSVSGLCERDAKLEFYDLIQRDIWPFGKWPLGGEPASTAAKWPSILVGRRQGGRDEVSGWVGGGGLCGALQASLVVLDILGSLNLAPSQSAGGLRKTCGHQNVGSLIPNSEAAGGELVSVGLRHHAAL